MGDQERESAFSLLSMYSDERQREQLQSQAIFGGITSALKFAKLRRTASWTKSVDITAGGIDSDDELLQWTWDVFGAY